MTSPAWRLTLSSPTSSAAVSAIKRVSSASLTSGGKSARKSRLAVAPKPPATPSAMRRIRSSTRLIVALLKQRTVSTARTLRATIDCSAVVMWLPTSTGSTPDSGRAPWAPRPVIAMSKNAPPAIIAPERIWNLPIARPGRLCMPKIASHGNSSKRPSLTIAAPPPRPSSAGWKMKCTVPSKFLVCARWRAAPSSIVVWPSWPQAVHIGPKPDRARRVADPQPPHDAGLAHPAMHLDAEPGELLGDQIRGALLLEPELRVGVDIPAPPGQLVVKGADFLYHRHRHRSPLENGRL